MDKYVYLCNNCGKEYIPVRRKVQKFCSNSCRTRAYQLRIPKGDLGLAVIKKDDTTKIDKMSLAGIGNAAAGTAIIKLAEALFTSEANKPATKSDIKNLEARISKRYYPIKNVPKNGFGESPYFDTVQSCVVYF